MDSIIKSLFDLDPRVFTVRHYAHGFIPLESSDDPQGEALDYSRDGAVQARTYDRRRGQGRGRLYVGLTEGGIRICVA